jgi:hypothetical protein
MIMAVVAATTTTPAAVAATAVGPALTTRIGIPFAMTAVRGFAATKTVIAAKGKSANPFPLTSCPLFRVEMAGVMRIEAAGVTGTAIVAAKGIGIATVTVTETGIVAEATTGIVIATGRTIATRFRFTTTPLSTWRTITADSRTPTQTA